MSLLQYDQDSGMFLFFMLTNIYIGFIVWRIQCLSWVSSLLKLKLSWYGWGFQYCKITYFLLCAKLWTENWMQVCPNNIFHYLGLSYCLGQIMIFQSLKQAGGKISVSGKYLRNVVMFTRQISLNIIVECLLLNLMHVIV